MILNGCSQTDQPKITVKAYFDLKGYFENEADRLDQLGLKVNKSVAINGIEEHKTIKIEDFNNELSSFIALDINKASWRGDFTVKKEKDITVYTANNEKIPVKKLEIQFRNNHVSSILIINKVDNILYRSADTLVYKPNQFYEIRKTQKIKLLKQKKYIVKGKLAT
ncbi:hypothetical protein [Pedobacter insulae]|uniref:Uncharacterized protein n=1 Tax=Pedobacter insulae TaxID=414048 RepID=A0A1I2U8T6_9SPHI|nr:hypothetical protein [Pedobacter insulae]SFG73574.1 hypothetical protein SAMN04489864_10234 [Pedobacter insulae]